MAMGSADGTIVLSRPGLVRVTCRFELADFPDDTQYCHLEIGSWSFGTDRLRLHIKDHELAFEEALQIGPDVNLQQQEWDIYQLRVVA